MNELAGTRAPVDLVLPFTGRWLVQNSPARRVPSHGTDMWGERYAIDFVGVDQHHRSAEHRDWRTLFATEPVERFVGFGRPILAPGPGTVVGVHDREPDHAGRRSQLALAGYMMGQLSRIRRGVGAVAGNHLIIRLRDTTSRDAGSRDARSRHTDAHLVLAHLRAGSIQVSVGDEVTAGQPVAQCGNSGNSTEPHLHLQVMDRPDPASAQGVPVVFRHFRQWLRRGDQPSVVDTGLPAEGAVITPESAPGAATA